jgi:hypothetical protein
MENMKKKIKSALLFGIALCSFQLEALVRTNSSSNVLESPKTIEEVEFLRGIFQMDIAVESYKNNLAYYRFSSEKPIGGHLIDEGFAERSAEGRRQDIDIFLDDSNNIIVSLRILEEAFGSKEINGRKILDVSYPQLERYVKKLEKIGAFRGKEDRLQTIADIMGAKVCTSDQPNAVNSDAAEKLCELAVSNLFVIPKEKGTLPSAGGRKIDCLADEDITAFKNILKEMICFSTGEQRIKSLLILQILIDNDIGNVGASFYKARKIRLAKTSDANRSAYNHLNHLLLLEIGGKSEGYTLFRNGTTNTDLEITKENLSTVLLHELSHTYHSMLGIDAYGLFNSIRAAYFADKHFREYLIPLLNKEVCLQIKKKIEEAGIKLSPINSWREDLKINLGDLKIVDEFLEANQFFGNDLLNEPTTDSERALRQITSVLILGWTNFEEVLTIFGVAPLKLSNKKDTYLFVDRQNESTQLTRDMDKYRLLHCSIDWILDFVSGEDKAKKAFWEIFSEAVHNANLSPYNPRDKMGTTPEAISNQFSDDTIAAANSKEDTATEIEGNIRRIFRNCYRGASGYSFKYYRALINDICRYANQKQVKICEKVVIECAQRGVLTVDLLEHYMDGLSNDKIKNKLNELDEMEIDGYRKGYILLTLLAKEKHEAIEEYKTKMNIGD